MLAHKHLILRGQIDTPTISRIEWALPEIVDLVRMKVLAPARVVYCEEEGNVGNTGDILLTTSHMVWHDWTREDGISDLQFDLYSCAPFDPQMVVLFLCCHFGFRNFTGKLFDRDYGIIEEMYLNDD